MKIAYFFAMGALLSPLLRVGTAGAKSSALFPHILTCGRSSVVESELGSNSTERQKLKPIWTWTAATSAGMPIDLIANFSTIDECKPANGGAEVLVTSSHDAVAIVSRADGATLFSARVKNAHSAALLSGPLIAVASSDATDGTGDRVVFFDRRVSGVLVGEMPFEAAHGLVWDESGHILWALGMHQLMQVHVDQEGGKLVLKRLSIQELPERVGHDLRMSSDCSALFLSTTHHVFRYDLRAGTFAGFGELADRVDVKSLSMDPSSGRLVFTVADEGGYWTSTLRLTRPSGDVSLASPIYKTRWISDLPPQCNVR